MSSFILAILTGAKTKINNFETVNTSSPSFLKIMTSLEQNLIKKLKIFKSHVMVGQQLERPQELK